MEIWLLLFFFNEVERRVYGFPCPSVRLWTEPCRYQLSSEGVSRVEFLKVPKFEFLLIWLLKVVGNTIWPWPMSYDDFDLWPSLWLAIGLCIFFAKWGYPRLLYSQPDLHDDVIKWKHFPRYWPFVRGIHRSSVNSPHKGQWRGALMFSLICVWINGWVNNPEAGDLRRRRGHNDVTVVSLETIFNVNLESISPGWKTYYSFLLKKLIFYSTVHYTPHI